MKSIKSDPKVKKTFLTISHYSVIKTMFMYFCVWFSWSWGWLQMRPKHVL